MVVGNNYDSFKSSHKTLQKGSKVFFFLVFSLNRTDIMYQIMILGSLIFQKKKKRGLGRGFLGKYVGGGTQNNQWMYYISCEIGFVKFFHYNKHGSIYRACTPSALAHFVYVRAGVTRVHKLGGLDIFLSSSFCSA